MRNRGFLVGLVAIAAIGTLFVLKGGAIERALLRMHGIHVDSADGDPGATAAVRAHDAVPASTAVDRDGWPETHAGRLAHQWVRAFSAGEEAMHAFLAQWLAPESLAKKDMAARLARYRELHAALGALTLQAIGKSEPAHLEVTLTDADGVAHEFLFDVEPDAPHKLVQVTSRERMHHGFGGGGH